ncbi:MAG: LysR family transcriptional regulator [Xanthobacteraceae bacterium]|nr:LysR family transcriptional regulator [Xanthobacteraceae bacterium]
MDALSPKSAASLYLRQLQYLTSLARHMHFGRAADECQISQPALSQAIQQLEKLFGVPIVDRGSHGFQGFTPHGNRVLDWARTVLSGYEHLNQELCSLDSQNLRGHIRLGVIPVAMPGISIITTAFNRLYPNVSVSVISLNFTDLKKGLDNFEIDIGINYLDFGDAVGFRPYFLYDESYYLIAPADHPVAQKPFVSWSEAGRLPLCMLSSDMQNRRILDSMFSKVGVTPRTVIETNCALALCSHVRPGHWFAVVPNTFFVMTGDWNRTRAIRLSEPTVTNAIGLLTVDREPQPPAIRAFVDVVQDIDMTRELMHYSPAYLTSSAGA